MNGNKEYKAQAFEYSHGSEYYLGEGVEFSNSIDKAIRTAKEHAYDTLVKAESNGDGLGGVPILATIMVWKRGKLIINETY